MATEDSGDLSLTPTRITVRREGTGWWDPVRRKLGAQNPTGASHRLPGSCQGAEHAGPSSQRLGRAPPPQRAAPSRWCLLPTPAPSTARSQATAGEPTPFPGSSRLPARGPEFRAAGRLLGDRGFAPASGLLFPEGSTGTLTLRVKLPKFAVTECHLLVTTRGNEQLLKSPERVCAGD